MKRTKILYWIFTVLFAGLMIFSAVSGVKPSEETVKMLHDGLGYPIYFIQFISVAKIVGALVILIPGLKTIKEWAYAGLFFDLGGAVYSGIAIGGKLDPMLLFMLVWIVPGILSYVYWKKTMRA
ncbi:MAG TPA: DoxX family protein [Flavitalea sp.]|nr:DoxX family protein [Flavitalea sp.]HTF29626.1 DoxX family protein [Flavitalea sp.]